MPQKGNIPWNKNLTKETDSRVMKNALAKVGKKRPDLISNKFCVGKRNSVQTEFKKKENYERIKYQYSSLIKNFQNERVYYKHEEIWMKDNHMGCVPKGCVVHHINGNSLDNRPENLILLPRNFHSQLHYKINQSDGKLKLPEM